MTAPEDVRRRIRDLALSVEGVRGVDLLRLRRSSLVLWVDIHVEVDGALTVAEGHRIAHMVKDRLTDSEIPVRDALVHVEPVS
ncbi:MAG: cation transporter dimerization domain-containing protein [Gemmatimonadota bacterium]